MTRISPVLLDFLLVFFFPALAPGQIITTQPQSVTVNNASTATFTVGASNVLAYQWLFDGSSIDGATNSALQLEDVMTNQEGSYTVVVTATGGSETSSPPAILTIVPGTIVRFTFSGLLTNAASNIDLQLFDHDKPATVENFLHYIQAGGFTNMFFDRCIPGFVLQGGDYGASNRTATSAPVTGWYIDAQFTKSTNQPYPPYPSQVASEFNVGPLIHNRFGTIAMALQSGNQNSANSAFFLNLVDNSANLDSQDSGFTVFGRILDGTNVLEYFNSLTNDDGLSVDSSIIFANGTATNQLQNLATDFIGTNAAANDNLVFCDFSFPDGGPPIHTNLPTVAITNAPAPTLLTNGLGGTASDAVGLALVQCVLTPQAAVDGTYPNGATNDAPETNTATGTTNWSFSLNPGNYSVSVQSQNGAGYLSAPATQAVTETGVLVEGAGTVNLYLPSNITANAIGYPMQSYDTYIVKAVPSNGYTFLNWNYANASGANLNLTNAVSSNFYYQGGVLTATFVQTNTPKGTKGISLTYPPKKAVVPINFTMKGTIDHIEGMTQVSAQIFSLTQFEQVGPTLTTTGVDSWKVAVTNLPPDYYVVQVRATNGQGFSTLISEEFIVQGFSTAAGTYNGLFICDSGPVEPTNSGFISIAVTKSGIYTAKLAFPGYPKVTTEYYFQLDGSSESPYQIFLNPALYVDFDLDVTNSQGLLTGTISERDGAWSANVTAYHVSSKLPEDSAPAGKYVLSLEPTNWPNTNGFAAMTLSHSGMVTLSGTLPDGATFSQSVQESADGVWPLYAVPSSFKGAEALLGWVTNDADGPSGELYWCKEPGYGPYITGSVSTNVILSSTNYAATQPGNFTIVFQGGEIEEPLTNSLTVHGKGGQFQPAASSDKLAISLSSSGMLSGHFLDVNIGAQFSFEGVFFGPTQAGAGSVFENNGQTGQFLLEPQ